MGKVFTITEGLENLGAMKTGGQGSVYKGKRIGQIITAIKLLPTPIYAETSEDKNFVDFQNEVQKLKKVNEIPNPNVVKILSSGVSDTGNFPFIEMEFIEGPELEELLKPPHVPIFTIKEALKVADQLSGALAHCHRIGVKHGDIKSNNVKFNIHTGNYVLLDFGLAVMSDEQRRTSLRHAGAIEFMAPEQNEGEMFFQTDVYSFGIILFELLAGTVPFPLHDKGETARNTVRLAHMETPPPDLLTLRRQKLPNSWSDNKKEHELHMPDWLVSMIYKCLEKKPENRFTNGVELSEYITLNSTLSAKKEEAGAEQSDKLQAETKKLLKEKDQLQQVILKYQHEVSAKDKELQELTRMVAQKDNEVQNLRQSVAGDGYTQPVQRGVSKTAFIALLFLTIGLGGFATYSFFKNRGPATDPLAGTAHAETNPYHHYRYAEALH
jgi:serine/threonine-protein kinase